MPNRSSGEKTKIILADSLRSLMKKKPFDKIKIREIVEECGLNRQTFYYHFQDVFALVEWMYKYDGQKIINDNYENRDIIAVARVMADYIERHREELSSIIESKAEGYFFDFLITNVGKCFDRIIDEKSAGLKLASEYKKFLSRYYTNAVIGVTHDWIKSPSSFRMTSDELIEMFRATTLGSMNLAFDNYRSITTE
ncbi:MAG: TetR/AcrR family transcriptional regulator C-terminal domain-containing protein [Clostridia bacterium]|nr:TetR/AcrR family transcriptional regulator C-terminal domain-containing protein [Clostridia bacterium]